MRCPTLEELPPSPSGKTGWPWTEESPQLPDTMPDGLPWPQVSLICPSYNRGDCAEEMIRSVLLQGYPDLVFTLADGGSTDQTVEIIRKYEKYMAWWVSERDGGHQFAFNKSLPHCTGEILAWLNPDDLWCAGALSAVATAWRNRPGTIIHGAVVNFDMRTGREWIIRPKEVSLENFIRWRDGKQNRLVWHQPGVFFPLEKVRQVGGLRESVRRATDHILMIDLLQRCEVQYIPTVLARWRFHAGTNTDTDKGRFRLEVMETLRQMPSLPIQITPRELRRMHARALLGCAAYNWRDRELRTFLRRVARATWLSPGTAFAKVVGALGRRLAGRSNVTAPTDQERKPSA